MHAMGARLWDEYGIWLVNHVRFRKRGFTQLMEKLHDTEFIYILDRDRNRADDGISLREEFYREKDVDLGVYDHRDDCSVLEMLVALAERITDEYIGNPDDLRPDLIFWDMITSLGLGHMDDRRYNNQEVNYKLHRWMYRDFDYDGRGSIFPIENPRRDQREIEIWAQMNEYLMERYW